jgi:uncharacterized membrane protein YdjX (TVP38/TMEM64 family)
MKRITGRYAKFGGIALTLGALILLVLFVDFETLRGYVEKAGPWAPLLFIALKASTVVIAPLGGGPLYPLVGAFFGFFPGILYAIIGDVIGYTTAFFISRKFGYPLVRKFIEDDERSILPKIVKHVGTAKGFFLACITLGFVPDLLSYGAGLSKLRYPVFIGIIAPLSAIISTILVLFGATIGAADTFSYILILPVVGVVALAAGAYFFHQAVSKKDPSEPPTI